MVKKPGNPPESLYLSAREAAAELGISQATLYAYVSRDMIRLSRFRGRAPNATAPRMCAPSKSGGFPPKIRPFRPR